MEQRSSALLCRVTIIPMEVERLPPWLNGGFVGGALLFLTARTLPAALVGGALGVLVVGIFSSVRAAKWWIRLPYWAKGGIAGVGIACACLTASLTCGNFRTAGSWGFECIPFVLPMFPVALLFGILLGPFMAPFETLFASETTLSVTIGVFLIVSHGLAGALGAQLLQTIRRIRRGR